MKRRVGAAPKIIGIYMITNIVNDKKYIGQSRDIRCRWRGHKSDLKRGLHENIILQNSWNKYGEENFKFSIIEECKLEELDKKEINYIITYNTMCDKRMGFNIESGGFHDKVISEFSKDNMRKGHPARAVLQLDKQGNIIRDWETGARGIERDLKINSTNIYRCCDNKLKESHGFIWQYKDTFNKETFDSKNFISTEVKRSVCQISLDGKLVKTWSCIRDAVRELNAHGGTISDCCKMGVQKTHKGFIWVYSEKYNPKTFDLSYYLVKNNIPVVQLTKDLEFVATWLSASQACLEYTGNPSTLAKCCKDTTKTYCGFKWMYEYEYKNVKAEKHPLTPTERVIIQLDLENNFIKEWYSQHEIERQVIKVHASNVNKCCKGIRKMTGGFHWMYKEDYEQLKDNITKEAI